MAGMSKNVDKITAAGGWTHPKSKPVVDEFLAERGSDRIPNDGRTFREGFNSLIGLGTSGSKTPADNAPGDDKVRNLGTPTKAKLGSAKPVTTAKLG